MFAAVVHPHGDGDELCDGFVAPEDVRDYFSKVFGGGGGGCGAGVCEFAGGFVFVGLWVVGVLGDEDVAVAGVAVETVADRRHAEHLDLAWVAWLVVCLVWTYNSSKKPRLQI